jgi:hypothetical protein
MHKDSQVSVGEQSTQLGPSRINKGSKIDEVIIDDVAERVMSPETNALLNSLPDIANTLMNDEVSWDEEVKGNQEHIESIFSEINMNEVPEGIMDPQEAIDIFISWEMLKNCTLFEPKVVQTTLNFLNEPEVKSLFESLFWIANIIKFQPDNARLIKKFRKRISNSYTTTLSKCPSPKEEVFAILQFCFGYLVHAMHHRCFPKQRPQFGIRFVLDCYHIVVYELTGLLVSDVYIYNQVEKLFGDRFFLYKQEGILDLTNIDLYEGSVFLQKTRIDPKDIEKLKLGPEVKDSIKKDFAEFGAELTNKFVACSKLLHSNSKANLMLAKFEGEFAKRMMDLTSKENFVEILQNRAKKINESRLRSEEEAMQSVANASGVIDGEDTNQTLNKKKKGLGANNSSSLPVLKIKQKFDCSQVSPPLQMAAKHVTASTKKKTIAFTSFNVPEFSVDKIGKLYDKYINDEKQRKLETKKKFEGKKNMGNQLKDARKKRPGYELLEEGKKSTIFESAAQQKYNQGSEQLNKDGVPKHLRDKFTEFFVINNVMTEHKPLCMNVNTDNEKLRNLIEFERLENNPVAGIDFQSIEAAEMKRREREMKIQEEEEAALVRLMSIGYPKRENLDGQQQASGAGQGGQDQKQTTLPSIKVTIYLMKKAKGVEPRRDLLSPLTKKVKVVDGKEKNYDIDYLGKMEYYDNQKYIIIIEGSIVECTRSSNSISPLI